MPVKIKFMSDLSKITGTREFKLETKGIKLKDLIQYLAEQFPHLQEELYDSEGNLDYVYQIVLNGRRLSWSQDKDKIVRGNDQLMIFAMLAGG